MRYNLSSQITLTRIPRKYYQPDDVFELSRVTQREKITTEIFETESSGALFVANEIAALIRKRQAEDKKCVLTLTAGRSTRGVYEELVRLHKEESLSFKNVIAFNLFEYYPLTLAGTGSYAQLHETFFKHIDIAAENIHTLEGGIDKTAILPACVNYEEQISACGGIDYLLLGIGEAGNIGFNEPGSQANSLTRLILLDDASRKQAVQLFGSVESVPISAITMGVGTILAARKIVLLAWGEHKALSVKKAVESPVTDFVPASYLQLHAKARMVIDLNAASELTRISHPWLVTSCEWDDKLIRRAIVWLCQRTGKPILKLTNKDYNENGLSELLAIYGSAYNVNIRIFNDLQHTITGWPGGKPNADDSNRPERATPYPKRVLIFSPHPDDDVISMGGTFKRLVDQNHDVHVAYQTSGNIAVGNDDIVHFLAFVKGFKELYDKDNTKVDANIDKLNALLAEKQNENGIMNREILELKGLLRRGEATAACRYVGISDENIHFLNLPFYETGKIEKSPISQADVDIIIQLLQDLKPHQIYVAGDLADPHGTHKVCLDAALAAIDVLKNEEWMNDCRIWMYRGAWKEWEIDHIEMAVPISPEELRNKRNSILRHHSQMENAPFLGNDERLFWQRSEDRNRATAQLYADLGLASYEAIEAFVQYVPID